MSSVAVWLVVDWVCGLYVNNLFQKMLTKIRSKLGFLLLRYQIEIFKSRLSLIQG